MFGIGWTEFIVIALVLLIFVGPRNLPPLLRKVGSIVAELKGASRELRNQLDAEVRDLELEEARSAIRDFGKEALDAANQPYEELREADRQLKADMARSEADYKNELREHEREASEKGDGEEPVEEHSGYAGTEPPVENQPAEIQAEATSEEAPGKGEGA